MKKQLKFRKLLAALFLSAPLFAMNLQQDTTQDDSDFEPYVQDIADTKQSFEMIPIPGGTFLMGSPENEEHHKADEGPVHEVELEPFYMSKYEITWDIYEVFMDKEGISFGWGDQQAMASLKDEVDAITRPSPPYEDPSFGMGKYGYPAASMTQYAALMFCKWLSTVTGEFYRLPTEAEWEYACRAGTTTPYYFGESVDDLDEYGWFYDNSQYKYHKVGEKKPNAWGLYDMHGNVSEWTLDQYYPDFYSQFKEIKAVSPWAKPVTLYPRSVRGGSYNDDPDLLRSAARIPSDPSKWKKRDPQIPKSFWWNTDSPFVGFRIVKPAKQLSPEEKKEFWAVVLDE
jgi:formylglycine-generating enzyme required for sulfatase activity